MVTTLELAQARVQLRRVGSEYHGPCPACGHGSGSTPETSDRLSIKESDQWFCRTCRPQGGSIITWLRMFEGKTCPEAHAAIGKHCDYDRCPAFEKCPAANGTGNLPRAARKKAAPVAPAPFIPQTATDPAALWQEQAAALIDKAHAALLDCPEQLAYLAKRGLPLEAVVKYRLGWIPEDRYGIRAQWGVEDEINPITKRKKTVWIPRGLLIPTIIEGVPHRLRIRRPNEDLKDGDQKYVEVKGSGDDRPLVNPQAKAAIVIESDLDALLIDWIAGDLVSAIAMVSCSAKPKATAHDALGKMLCILVSLDYDARQNGITGKYENPGGASSQWWLKEFTRAKRWPTPAGKDPGEFYSDHGGDLRAWILQGLPPIFHLAAPVAGNAGAACCPPKQSPVSTVGAQHAAPALDYHGEIRRALSAHGRIPYAVAWDQRDLATLVRDYPDHGVFHFDEMAPLKGLPPETLDLIIQIRITNPGSEVIETRPYDGPDPAAGSPSVRRGATLAPTSSVDPIEQQELAI